MRAGYPETVYFDYDADKILLGDNPAGHKVEAGATAHAFSGTAGGVTVRNLVIEKYAPPIQRGAIQGGVNWTIQDNGNMGLGGAGDGILVEGDEIARNGGWSGIDVFWEGGGTKFAHTKNLIVRRNHAHDNTGFGLWTDIDNVGTLYENNLVVGNSGGSITHEISYDAVIRNNTLAGNIIVSKDGNGQSGGAATHNELGLLAGGNVWGDNQYHMPDGDRWVWGEFPVSGNWAAYMEFTDQDGSSGFSQAYPDTSSWLSTPLAAAADPNTASFPSFAAAPLW